MPCERSIKNEARDHTSKGQPRRAALGVGGMQGRQGRVASARIDAAYVMAWRSSEEGITVSMSSE